MRFLAIIICVVAAASAGFAQQADTTKIKVYFLTEKGNEGFNDCRKVAPVIRHVPKTKAVATAALEELFKGPTAEERTKMFSGLGPDETRGILKSVNVKRGAAYVNFTKLVYEQMGTATTSCGAGFFSSIEKTLTQFPTIKKIFYAIDGDVAGFYDWVQVGECPRELKNCDNRNFIK